MIKKNTAGQFIYFVLVSTTDGSAVTGASPTGYVSIDAAAQTGMGGSITELANGQYKMVLSQGDTNGDEIGYFITNAGAIPVSLSVTTETKKMADLNDIAAGALMGLADDAITSAKYDESTAFSIKSDDAGASQIARVGADGDTLESLSDEIAALPTDADVNAACDTALSDIHLDHLLGVDFDSASPVGNATSFLRQLVEDDSATLRFTANTLEEAPGATSDATEAKQDLILEDLVDIKGTGFVKDTDSMIDLAHTGDAMTLAADAIKKVSYDETTAWPLLAEDVNSTKIARTGADSDTLETLSDEVAAVPDAAAINAQVDAAIETYHLDHLLAVTYDPASKPGAADALLNELVESDGGVSRFTENSLEEAPSGTGGDATAANQVLLLEDIVDMKGTGFVKDTDSMVDLAHIGADADTLEDLSDEIAAVDGKIDTIDGIVDFIQDLLEGNHSINTGVTPWRHLIKRISGDATILEKELFEEDGTTDIEGTDQVIGAETEPA